MDTVLAIPLICDADRRTIPEFTRPARPWRLVDCVNRCAKAGYDTLYELAEEWAAEAEARKIGKEKGVRFRCYKAGAIGMSGWPIKAHGNTPLQEDGTYAWDFRNWREVLTWIRGL